VFPIRTEPSLRNSHIMALGSPELRHLPAIEDELSQPMTEQSRMTSNIFPDLKLYPKEEGDTLTSRY